MDIDAEAAGDLAKLEADNQDAVAKLKSDAAANKAKVIKMLMEVTCNVSTAVPDARKGVKGC